MTMMIRSLALLAAMCFAGAAQAQNMWSMPASGCTPDSTTILANRHSVSFASVKHATGNITVRIEKTALDTYSLSVLDDGPGLPVGFEAAKSKGLGTKLILRFVNQIGGDLQIIPRDDSNRACFTVSFS